MSQIIEQSPPLTRSTEKFGKTRYEIDQLKTQIETLISSNIKNKNVEQVVQQSNLASTVTVDTNLSKSPVDTNLSKSPVDTNLSKSPVKTEPILTKSSPGPGKLKSPISVRRKSRLQSRKSEPNLLLSLEEECKSKARSYDPESTRDFIKKQRSKRKFKMEEELRIKTEFAELKNKRLEDLRHKTHELLIDNVMMKSNKISAKPSEDKKPNTGRTDVCKFNAQVANKRISRDELQSRRCRYRSFDHEPRVIPKKSKFTTNIARLSPQRSKSVNRELKFDKPVADKEKRLSKTKSQEYLQKAGKSPKVNNKVDNALSNILESPLKIDNKTKATTNTTASQTSFSLPKSELNLDNKQNTFIKEGASHSSIKPIAVPVKKVKEKIKTEVKEKYTCPFNFKSKSVETSFIENIPPESAGNINQNQALNKNNTSIQETSAPQIKKDKKEEFPAWLQQNAFVQPYPYNFISAVRKKLEIETKNNIPKMNFPTTENGTGDTVKVPEKTGEGIPTTEKPLDKKPVNIPQITEHSNKKSVDIPQLIPPQITEHSNKKSVDISEFIPPQVTEHSKAYKKSADIPLLVPPQAAKSFKTYSKSVDIPQLIPPQVIEHSKTYNSHKVRKQLNYSVEPEEIHSNKQSSTHSNKSNKISIDSDDSDTTKNVPELPHEDAGKTSEFTQNIDKNILQKISLKFPKRENKIFTRQLSNISSVSNYSDKSDIVIPKNITLERNFDISDLKLPIPSHKNEKRYNLPDDIDRILNQYSDRVKSQTSTISATEYEQIAVNLPEKPKLEITLDKKSSNSNTGIMIESKTIKKVPSASSSANSPVPGNLSRNKLDTSETKTDSQFTFVSENVLNSAEIFNANIPKLVKPDISLNPHKDKSITQSLFNTINFKRGCDISDKENFQHGNLSICPRDLTLQTVDNKSVSSNFSNICPKQQEIVIRKHDNPYVCLSLGLVDQMIQDEDVRLQHLSSIIKIRDKTLFDRTRGEIAWLEIQKKQFKENGQVDDVTSIKKKQRGLLIKLEQERYEMRRLKQAHKEAAKARKTALCEQKNLIKLQLASTDQIPKKLRRLSNSERPKFGPVKVTSICESTLYRVDAQREVASQSSSRKDAQDVNVTTDSSVVQQVVQTVIHQTHTIETEEDVVAIQLVEENVKKELSMKEADLDIRRKVAKKVLQWRQRLEQEEEVVVELERRAAKPILLDDDPEKTRYFTGEQLNKIWNGFTGFSEMKYDTSKKYKMSKRSLDKLFQSAMKRLKELPEESRRSRLNGSQLLSSYSSTFDHNTTLDSSSSIATEIKNLSNKSSAKRVPQIKPIDSNAPTEENSLISNNFKLEKSNKSGTIGSISQNENTSLDQQSSALGEVSDELNDNTKLIPSRKTSATRTSISKQLTNLEETLSSKSNKVSTVKTSDSKVSTILDDDQISAHKNEINSELIISESEIIPSARSKITEEPEIPASKSLIVSEEASSVKTQSECVVPEESINTAVTESSIKVHEWLQLNYNSSKKLEDDKATTITESIATEISNYASDSSIKEHPIKFVAKSKISEITSVDDIADSAPIESDKISNVRTELSTNISDTVNTVYDSISSKIKEGKESESIIESVETNLEDVSESFVSEKPSLYMENKSVSSEIKEDILSVDTNLESISEKLSFHTENELVSSEIKEEIVFVETSPQSTATIISERISFPARNASVSSEIKEEILSGVTTPKSTTIISENLSIPVSSEILTIDENTTARSVVSEKPDFQTKTDSNASEIKEEILSVGTNTTARSVVSEKLDFKTKTGSDSSEIKEEILSGVTSHKSTTVNSVITENLSISSEILSVVSEKLAFSKKNDSDSSEINEEILSIDTNTTAKSIVSEKLSVQIENNSVSSEIQEEILSGVTSPSSTVAKSIISEKLPIPAENESVSSEIQEDILSVETNLEEISPKTTVGSEIKEKILLVDSTDTVNSERLSALTEYETISEAISLKSTISNLDVSENDIFTIENHSDTTSLQSNDQLVQKASDAESNQLLADLTTESKIESDKSLSSIPSYENEEQNIIKTSSSSSIRSNVSIKSNVPSELIIDLPTDKFEIEIQEELIIVLESPKSEELQNNILTKSSVPSARTVDEEPNILSADSLNSIPESESNVSDSTVQNKSLGSVDPETLHSNSKLSTDQEIALQCMLEECEPDASPRKSTSSRLGSGSEYDNETFEDKNSDASQKSSTREEDSIDSSIKSEKLVEENVELSTRKAFSADIFLESEKSIGENKELKTLTESLEKTSDATEVSLSESLQQTLDQNAASPNLNETFNRLDSGDSNQMNVKSTNSSPRSSKSHQENSSNTSSEILEKSLDNSGTLEENKILSGMDDTNVKGVKYVDVFKRVSEILADMTSPRTDKSPRVQDLYTTTYDIVGTSSENTSESGSPSSELSPPDKTKRNKQTPFKNEEEELLRKQLAIEREIKRIEQETIPFTFVREIPNKPPPPYKPPDFPLTHVVTSIIPTQPEKAKELISKAHETIFRAYNRGELAKVEYKSKKDPKEDLQRFVFDLCKEVALNVCKPKVESKIPSWRTRRYGVHSFVKKRAMDNDDLHSVLNKKVLQLLNFEPSHRNDSLIIRWCLKKRDHVDEILVLETQTEEPDWTNYEEDEDVVKENLMQNILNMLLDDTAKNISQIMDKKKSFRWS